MKYLFSIAVKNILRYKRRTVLTFIILSVGIAFYLLMVGMVEGYKKQSINNFINFDTGHIKIRSMAYDKDTPFSTSNFIANYRDIETVLRQKKFVTAYTERLNFLAEIDNGKDDSPCVVVGIDPQKDSQIFTLTNYIIEGSLEKGGSLIGSTLAKDFELAVGDYYYITFRNGQGAVDSIELVLTGVVTTEDPVVNNSMIYINMDEAQKYLNMDQVTEISLKTENYKKDASYLIDLRKSLPNYQIDSWRKLSESVVAASKHDEIVTYVFVFFIMIIALVGIINTMLMSVFEKKREIGTLKAMGMTDKEVETLFVIEGAVIGISGGVLGIVLGIIINWYFVTIGYDITPMIGKGNENIMAAYRLMGVMKSAWVIPSYFTAFFACLTASMLASFYPARKATRLQPVDCLRTV